MMGETTRISLRQATKSASSETRKRAFKLWIAARLFASYKNRGYIYLSHAYLRWIDNFIDDPLKSTSTKKNFLSNQLNLLQNYSTLEDVNLHEKEEFYIYYLVKHFAEIEEVDFVNCFNNILKSFEMDVNRLESDGMFSESTLREYLTLLNESIFRISFYFIPIKRSKKDIKGFIGNFFWYVLAIRDFKEDLDAGFINILREDIKKYNLDNSNLLEDNKRFDWLKDHYPKLQQVLNDELIIMSKMPFFVKILWVMSYFNLIGEFVRIRYYDYKFGMELMKNPIKEVKILMSTLDMSIRILVKVFLK